jgi:hypothetical protein
VAREAEEDRGGDDPAQDEADHQGDQWAHELMLGRNTADPAVSVLICPSDGAVFT